MSDHQLERAYGDHRVCVTGGAGFIGSHLCDRLVELGANVSIIDDLSTGSQDNLEPVRSRVNLVRGSIAASRSEYFRYPLTIRFLG